MLSFAIYWGWLLGDTWVYSPAHLDLSVHFHIQLPRAGFYAEKCRERGKVGSSIFTDSEERNECQETQEQELVAIKLGEAVT